MGGYEGQTRPVPTLAWTQGNTDELRLTRQLGTVPVVANRPSLDGRPVHAFHYLGEIVRGFGTMFDLLGAHRDDLLRPGGPLARGAAIQVRVLLRPTRFYSTILDQSFHPDTLRDAVDRDRLFDRLWYGVEDSRYRGLIQRIVGAEKRQLWQVDIPYFHTFADSHDLWAATGERFDRTFSRSGLEMAAARLRGLDAAEYERQTWYIKSALATYAGRFGEQMPQPYPRPRRSPEPTRERAFDAALAIARRLEMLARVDDGEASWVGLSPVRGQGWRLQALGLDLYSGMPGVVLFLAYCADLLGSAEVRATADRAFACLRNMVHNRRGELPALGAFAGWGGLVHAWIHLASLWNRDDLLAEARGMLEPMAALVDGDTHLDLSHGAAGAVVPVLELFRRTGDPAAIRLAIRLGDHLVARAEPTPDGGVGWPVLGVETRILTGFSHGAAGISWALLELFAQTGESRFRDCALAALAFEDATFSAEERNWPDLRARIEPGGSDPLFMAAWCHGATGIGLSRLRIGRRLRRKSLRRDVEAAVAATLRKGFGNNHCLCHGDLGSLELLLEAAPKLAPELAAGPFADRFATVLASIEQNGPICGLPFSVESPGLLEGIAGIGYGLLRMAVPSRVPSILLLDPPPARTRKAAPERRSR